MSFVKRYWADLPLQTKGVLIVAIPVLALFVSLALSYKLNQQRAEAWVVHSYQVRVDIQRVYTSVAEASTGVRGFLLSGRKTFLGPYKKALVDLPEALASLTTLVADNPEQEARARRIETLVNGQLGFLERLLSAEPPVAARNALLVESKRELDLLRALLEDMRGVEAGLLTQRASKELAARNAEFVVLELSGLLGLIGGVGAVVLFVGLGREFERTCALLQRRSVVLAGKPLTTAAATPSQSGSTTLPRAPVTTPCLRTDPTGGTIRA